MNLLIRLLVLLLATPFKARLGLLQASVLRSRVWPLDLDLNLHMTNSRYLALADLGRLDLILRTGAWRAVRRGRMGVVLGGSMVRYRRALRPFERFTLSTVIFAWDERWFFLRQVFTGRDGEACSALMRAGFTRGGRLVPPAEVLALAGLPTAAMPPPDWVRAWSELEAAQLAAGNAASVAA